VSAPSVSVLIPTFNRASFLPETLASVMNQTLAPQEVILIDDGSTDDTSAVVASLLSTHTNWGTRLRVVRQENGGKSAALNKGLALAAGEWIAFNDSDDTWMPEKLERQFEALRRYPECLAAFTETSLNEFSDRHPEIVASALDSFGKVEAPGYLYVREWPGTYQQTVVVRADVLRRCGEIDTRYLLGQDVDFLFRLGLITPFCFTSLPLVVINREEQRDTSLMGKYPATSWTAMLEAESRLSKWLSLLSDHDPALRKIIQNELGSARSALANRYVLVDEMPAARRILRKAYEDTAEIRLLAKLSLAYALPPLLRALVRRRAPLEFRRGEKSLGTTLPSGQSPAR
jgi:glycosyltransferase involved in cell wall biosynthesis